MPLIKDDYKNLLLQKQPVNYWRLGESSGNALDVLGEHDLTWAGTPVYSVTGALTNDADTAMTLDGSTEYTAKTISSFRNSDSSGTISYWVKTSYTGADQAVVSSCDTGTTLYRLSANITVTNGYPCIYQVNNDTVDIVEAQVNITDGNWHHIVITSSGTAYAIYIDGVNQSLTVTSGSNTGDWFADTTLRDNLVVGAQTTTSTGLYFNGALDEVAVFNYELTAEDVRELYYRGIGYTGYSLKTLAKGAANYWRLGESSGNAIDELGVDDLTWSGTPTYSAAGALVSDADTAMTLDGSTDYAKKTIANYRSADNTGTICAWFKTTLDHTAGGTTILSSDDEAGANDRLFFGIKGVTDANRIHFGTVVGGSGNSVIGGTVVNDGAWHFGVVTTSGSAWKLYVDGIEESLTVSGANNGSWFNDLTNRDQLALGCEYYSATPTALFNGSIDDVSVFSTELSAADIWQLYLEGLAVRNGDYYNEVMALQPVNYWRLGESSGNAIDAIGIHDLTWAGTPVYSVVGALTGDSDTSMTLDGSTEYAEKAVADYRSTDTTGTVVAWFKTSDATAHKAILSVSDEATTTLRLYFFVRDTGAVSIFWNDGATSNGVNTTATGFNDGNWHHVAFVSSGTAWSIYIDGVSEALTVAAGTNDGGWFGDLSSGTDNLTVGAMHYTSVVNYFNGTLDEVAVYNTALTAAQIRRLYYRGLDYKTYALDAIEIGPANYWRLGESSGNAIDVMGQHDLVWAGTPVYSEVGAITSDTDTSMTLDGSTEYASKTTADYLSADYAGSIVAWVKTSTSGAGQVILSSGDTAGPSAYFIEFIISTTGVLQVYQVNADTADNITGNTAVNDGSWHHVALVSSGTAYTMYVDGVNEGTLNVVGGSNTGDWFADTTVRDNVTVGALIYTATAGYFNGSLDDVTVYSSALTEAQVRTLYIDGLLQLAAGGTAYYNTLTEALSVLYGLGGTQFGSLSDSMALSYSSVTGLNKTITESLLIYEDLGKPGRITENMTLSDVSSFVRNIIIILSETFNVSTTILTELCSHIRESIATSVTIDSNALVNRSISDSMAISAALIYTTETLLIESMTMTGSGSSYAKRLNTIVENLVASGIVQTNVAAINVVAEALAVSGLLEKFFWGLITEGVVASGTALNSVSVINAISEVVNNSDTASHTITAYTQLDDDVNITSVIELAQHLQGVLNDSIGFAIIIEKGAEQYTGYVLNPEIFGVTTYSDYNFNSIAKFNDDYYGSNSSGIYKLSGSSDNGTYIQPKLVTAGMSFGSSNIKYMPQAYLGLSSDGTVVMKVRMDDDTDAWYELTSSGSGLHTQRIKLGKGLRGRYWQFEFVGQNLTRFDLDSIELFPVITGRKI